MKCKEALAGAPIFRGRLAAIVWLWSSGYIIGDTDYTSFLGLVKRNDLFHTYWAIDVVLSVISIAVLVAGVLSLDQYGRNAWFAWAPDDAEWSGLKRSDVKTTPRLRPLYKKVSGWFNRGT